MGLDHPTQSSLYPLPAVMGILNVTPDSFADGCRTLNPQDAIQRARNMVVEGADLIDVGGESTRPGAEPVPAPTQIQRTVAVIRSIREHRADLPISIDTQSSEVAAEAIDAGATIINDVSAMTADPDMAALIAERKVGVILMHMRGRPRTMQDAPRYDDVIAEVIAFLQDRFAHAHTAGVDPTQIMIDPGIGFGKDDSHNLALIAAIPDLRAIAPVVLGVSRKSFMGRLLGLPDPLDRDTATTIVHAVALLNGVSVLRTHNVVAARQCVTMIGALAPHLQEKGRSV
jgi:dihydropteroate synthase